MKRSGLEEITGAMEFKKTKMKLFYYYKAPEQV